MKPDQMYIYLSSAFLAWLIWLAIKNLVSDRPSHFKLRESDRVRNSNLNPKDHEPPTLNPTLLLEGFIIQRPDHEILGVSTNATQDEIRKAYKTLMKQYHPDRVGRPGSREWNDAQKIAERINLAKSNLMKSRQSS